MTLIGSEPAYTKIEWLEHCFDYKWGRYSTTSAYPEAVDRRLQGVVDRRGTICVIGKSIFRTFITRTSTNRRNNPAGNETKPNWTKGIRTRTLNSSSYVSREPMGAA